MKIISAGFSKTFPINQYYEKVWLEAELNEGEDERQVLYDLKKKVENFFYESSAAAEKQMGTQITNVPVVMDEKMDQEWQQIKDKLLSLESKDEAQEYLDTTSYNMTIEAKQIINSKKSKNEKK